MQFSTWSAHWLFGRVEFLLALDRSIPQLESRHKEGVGEGRGNVAGASRWRGRRVGWKAALQQILARSGFDIEGDA